MTDLIPLLLGLGIIILGMKLQFPKGPAINRPAFGLYLIAGSLLWWLSSAMLLTSEGKFRFTLNFLTLFTFFLGLAFFVPPPPGATRPNQHRPVAHIIIAIGFVLGLAHSLALLFLPAWPARLLQFYAALGLHRS